MTWSCMKTDDVEAEVERSAATDVANVGFIVIVAFQLYNYSLFFSFLFPLLSSSLFIMDLVGFSALF